VQLVALAAARLVLNTGLRVVYPYAPALARGLGVSREEIYALFTLRNATGFFSPLFGPLSERYGRKIIILVGLLVFALGFLTVAFLPLYWVLGLALLATGMSRVLFDPAMQAYIGDVVPYARRGKALALTEYSWAFALLVGAPLVGLAIQLGGWRSPFLWLGVLALMAIGALWLLLPRGQASASGMNSWRQMLHLLGSNSVVLYAGLYMALMVMANEMLFIVFGGWMEDSFQLSLTSLGIAAAVIGGAELVGETFAAWSVDRFGKRPVIIAAGSTNALFYLILPFTSATLTGALLTLFFLFITFEITVVGSIPLFTELVPQARAVVMSISIASMFVGRTFGSLIGPRIWAAAGIEVSGIVWAATMALAVVVLVRKVHEA
jgi:predicted MFS family arabinose efflux permease